MLSCLRYFKRQDMLMSERRNISRHCAVLAAALAEQGQDGLKMAVSFVVAGGSAATHCGEGYALCCAVTFVLRPQGAPHGPAGQRPLRGSDGGTCPSGRQGRPCRRPEDGRAAPHGVRPTELRADEDTTHVDSLSFVCYHQRHPLLKV